MVRVHVLPSQPHRFTSKTAYSRVVTAYLCNVEDKRHAEYALVRCGRERYFTLSRKWQARRYGYAEWFDMRLRGCPGTREAANHVSLYQGARCCLLMTRA